MAGSTEFNVWNSCSTISFDIAVAEGTVQIDPLFVNEMVEQNGLIDGLPSKDREDSKKDFFCLILISMEGDGSKKNQDNKNEKVIESFHTYFIILDGISLCQEKSLRGPIDRLLENWYFLCMSTPCSLLPNSFKEGRSKGVRVLSKQASSRENKLKLSKAICLFLALSLSLSFSNSIAQEKKPKKLIKIGIIQTVSRPDLDADAKGFEKALAEAGFKEGIQIAYIRKNSHGRMADAQTIAKKFVEEKVDLIHSIALLSSQVVVMGIKNIPIVFSSVSDPVRAGLIPKTSLPETRTGTNVTGVSDRWPVNLQFEMSTKFIARAKKWGTIYNRKDPNSLAHIKGMRESAKKLGVGLIEAKISIRGETLQAAQSLSRKVQAIHLSHDHTVASAFKVIVKVCNEKKIPLFTGDIYNVSRGAIAAYGLDYYLVGYSAGKKAVQILRGEKPGNIPWGLAENCLLVINEGAAKAQGVIIPPDLLKKADRVIEK